MVIQEGNKKKKWAKPKLIILTRGNEQEIVLAGCKAQYYGGPPNKGCSPGGGSWCFAVGSS